MSKNWETVSSSDVQKNVIIGDLVEAGGTDYKLLRDNCSHATCRMKKETEE